MATKVPAGLKRIKPPTKTKARDSERGAKSEAISFCT